MPNQDDKFWGDIAARMRRALWLRELSKEEADREYEAAESMPLSDDRIKSMVEAAMNDEAAEWTAQANEPSWEAESCVSGIAEQVFQLNRNRDKDEDEEIDDRIEQHRREAFGDD